MLGHINIIEFLERKNYDFTIHSHPPLFSVEDSNNMRGEIDGTHTKNLFLKNKKNDFFMISCEENETINLKNFSKSIKIGNVSFANEHNLNKLLGVKPGSVSPFALLNDKNNLVDFYLEKKLNKSELINFHPLINTKTITIKAKSFIDFMIENKKKIHIFCSKENKVLDIYE